MSDAPVIGIQTDHGWSRAHRLLCVRLDTLGDVLMTGPAIRALREARPDRHITLLTSPSGAEAGGLLPYVDDVLVYEAPWMKATPSYANGAQDLRFIETLRDRRFDGAVIFTVYSQNPLPAALLCYYAEIPLRLAHCRENPYQLLTHWVRDTEPAAGVRHEVERQLALVATIGASAADRRLAVTVPSEAARRAETILKEAVDMGRPWVVMHPGATAPSRRYPAEAFAAAARTLVQDDGWQVLFTGTASERELIGYIQSLMECPSRSLAGELSLADWAALLARAPLLISNNTGAVHVAAAVGTPVVDLYALTNPQHQPWMVPHRVLFHDVACKFCHKSICPEGHHHCLRLVTPRQVVEAARDLLASATPASSSRSRELPCVYLGH